MHEADDAKTQTDEDLGPDHNHVGVVQDSPAAALKGLPGLSYGRPRRQPANAEREAPGHRGDDQVILCDIFEDKVVRQKRDHACSDPAGRTRGTG